MITIGPITFHLYGLLIGLGILAGGTVAERLRVRLAKTNKQYQKFIVWDSLLWITFLGIVGARAYHVLDYWNYYSAEPVKILYLSQGGLGIFGGIVGGLIGAWIAVQNKKTFLRLIDLLAIGAPLGQAIGRWGNYFNQELYGLPTKLPWGIYIPVEKRMIEFIDVERFHPVFFYEMIWNLAVFLILLFLVVKNKLKVGRGAVLTTYLGFYGLGRFFFEYLKINPWQINGLNVAQVISLGMVILAVVNLTGRR
jgi:phosphatidylglycerol:prolipoprotein diacylglycerol transferase